MGVCFDIRHSIRYRMISFTIAAVCLIIALGPMDLFNHGFYCDKIDIDQIAEEDYLDVISIQNESFSMEFSPLKRHFAGFEVYFLNPVGDKDGCIYFAIIDQNGKTLERVSVALSEVEDSSWYQVYTSKKLKKGEVYTLSISTENCEISLQNIHMDYLSDETRSGNALIAYAYAESTFTFQNKIIIGMFIIAIWLWGGGSCLFDGERKRNVRMMAIVFFMTAVLAWNYMYNSMDNHNSRFASFQSGEHYSDTLLPFQADSEALVTGAIYAERDNAYFWQSMGRGGYGLVTYVGLREYWQPAYKTDENWLNGYSRTEAAILVSSNPYTQSNAVAGNYIVFKNGEERWILETVEEGAYLVIRLDGEKMLGEAKNGSLDDIQFYDANNNKLPSSFASAYTSSFGLQGKIFRYLAKCMDEEQTVMNLNLLCSLATAFVFVIIVFVIAEKYNSLLAGCFFITFWLSPWIVNFAKNLYWLEFTWFLPMLVGLVCAWKIANRKVRFASYMAAYICITAKCLCGYEYISTIMLGLIAFLFVDLVVSFAEKDQENVKLLTRTIVALGCSALLGFVTAIIMHANLRGCGDAMEGIKIIWEQDVLRRTLGGHIGEFNEVYAASLNASIWEVICLYFRFDTEIITGVEGNLFPLLCIIPLAIFVYQIYRGWRLDVQEAAMYGIFFLTTISWFILGKAHSYIHASLNRVLWYFGFIQVCIYIIVNQIVRVIKDCQISKR